MPAQNYNRYSYALNNPLKYVDPSGYYFVPAKDIINEGYYDLASQTGMNYLRGVNNNFYSTAFTNSGFAGASTETVTTVSYDKNGKPVYEYKQALVTKGKSGNVIGVQVYEKEEKGKNNDDSLENEQQSDGDGSAGGDIIYKEGAYSFSDFNLQFLLAKGKGLLGGWSRVRGSAKVYRGKDGVYYVNVSAVGFTPSGIQGGVTFSGNVEVYSGGNLVGTQSLNRLEGTSIIHSGWQNVGQGTFALPSYGSDVYLRFNVGYTYSEGAGYVSPWPAQGHTNLYIPYFVIDAWTY